jgi:hypothetical protein
MALQKSHAYLALLILIGSIVHILDPQFVPRVGRLVRQSPAVMENVYSGDIAITMGQRNGWGEAQSQRRIPWLELATQTACALRIRLSKYIGMDVTSHFEWESNIAVLVPLISHVGGEYVQHPKRNRQL